MSASEKINQPLGIIAGGGEVPQAVLNAARAQGRDVYIAALEHSADESLCHNVDHDWYALGQGGSIIKALRQRHITDIVMIGRVKRPNLKDIRPDLWTTKVLARIGIKALGDNDLLVLINDALEAEGFKLQGAQDVAPDLLTPEGLLTKAKPSRHEEADIAHGKEIAKALGIMDVGQSVIVYDGVVLGMEGAEGTDALIARCAEDRGKKHGGVLVKLCKPQQDKRLDLPTIGPQTLDQLHKYGYAGVAIHAGNSLLPARNEFIEKANKSKLFVIGVTA